MSRTRLIVSAIFIVILGLLAAPAVWAGGLKTDTTVALSLTANGDAVLLADVNADTKNDLIVAECGTGNVKIFPGDGLGGFGAATTVALGAGVCPKALAVGNLTGAATHDIVVGDTGGKVWVLVNNGALSFTKVSTAIAGANITGVAVADFDGDGKQDIVASSNEASPKVYLLRGNGLVAWATLSTTSYAVGTAPLAIVAADFNGDGQMDLATANSTANTVSILTNTTAPYPGTPVTFSAATVPVASTPNAIAAGFVGTSGKPDLVVSANGVSKVSVLLNDGSGGFPATSADFSLRQPPTGIALADFNADTVNDIVVSASDGAEILFNNGSGTSFTLSPDVFTAGASPAGIATNTLNGDSLADVAVVNSINVSILLGTPFYNITPTPVSAQEGVQFTGSSLMTFKYDGASPTFSATIDNWGDGLADTCPTNCTVTGPDGSGVYTLQGDHKYLDPGAEGTKNIFLTVTDTAATPNQAISITASSTATTSPARLQATVADAPLDGTTPATGPLADGTPGSTYTNAVVANFTDPNTSAAATDFTAMIDWDDCGAGGTPHGGAPGTCSPGNLVAGTVSISGGGGASPTQLQVKGTNTFNTIGTFTISTNIKDTEATVPAQPSGINVSTTVNISSITGTPATFSVTEGKQFTGVTLATFSTSRVGALASDFTATVTDWHDGLGTVSEVQTVTGSAPNFTVASVATTKYKNLGSYSPVVIQVKDNVDGSVTTIDSTANVGDGVLTITTNNQTINEGGTTAAVGSFTDEDTLTSATDYTVHIDWGDCGAGGTPHGGAPGTCAPANLVTATGVTGGSGSFNINDTSPYNEEGSYPISVTVVDNDSLTKGPTAGTITVNDAPLVPGSLVVNAVAGGGSGPSGELIAGVDTWNGTLATFQDSYTGAPTSDFDILVDWGDGQTTNCPHPCALVATNGPAGSFKIVASHLFVKAKTQLTAVTVTVTDFGGAAPLTQAGPTASVGTLFNPVPVNVNTAVEGTVFNGLVGHFDLGLAGDLANTTATITWDDPNCNNAAVDPNLHCTSPGTIALVGGNTYSVSGSHTYAEERTPAISVAVTDATPNVNDNLNISGGANTVAEAALSTPNPLIVLGPVDETAAATAPPTLNGVTVLVFNDANALAAACPGAGCDFAATIHWADGTSSAGTVTGPVGGPYTVTGSHNYTEGGLDPLNPGPGAGQCTAGAPALCHITVDITDDLLPTTIAGYHSADAQVNDAALGSVTVNPVTGANSTNPISGQLDNTVAPTLLVANVDTWKGVLATFTDTNTGALASDFTIDITWGDPTSGSNVVTCAAPCTNPANPVFVQSTGPGAFEVVASHMFAKAGSLLGITTVKVTDIGGAAPINANGPAAVVTSLYQPVVTSITPTEGMPFTGGVGNFTATTGDAAFNITVNWGDGTTNAQPAIGGPTWTVNGTHTYAEETLHNAACGNAPCPLTVTITDPADGSTMAIKNGTATIADAPLVGTAAAPLAAVNEGASTGTVTVMTFTDANTGAPACPGAGCDFTATIHWGDGTTSAGTVTGPLGGPFTVTGSHTYTEGGLDMTQGACTAGSPATCPVTVDVLDELAPTAIAGFAATTASINDAPLSSPVGVALAPPSLTVTNVTLGSFHDGNPGAPVTDFVVTINWGDATSSAGTVTGSGGNYSVVGSHTYSTTGTLFNVSITVQDVGGAAPLTINSTILTPASAGLDFNGTASPPSSSILPGQSVDALMTLSPTLGFNSTVTFTGCMVTDTSNNPVAGTNITCTFNPASVPDVSTVHTAHMIVQTFSGTAMMNAPRRPGTNDPVQLAMLLPGFVGLFGVVLVGGPKKDRRTRLALWLLAGLLLLAVVAIGCGGGGASITPGPGGNGTPAGTYRVHALMSGTANPPDIFVTITVQ